MNRLLLILGLLTAVKVAAACTYKIDHAIETADFNVDYTPCGPVVDAGAKDAAHDG